MLVDLSLSAGRFGSLPYNALNGEIPIVSCFAVRRFSRAFTVISVDVDGTATASTHRVNKSVITEMYLLPLSVHGNGPAKSIDTISNRFDTIIGCSSSGVC
ncbi:hypothetical protein AYI68_g7525, partial [Smittium mucronatum]